jgi:colanic acid biosynthesis glycosyl transferase WcaI
MKILIYAINFKPELTGCGKYTGEKAARLAAMGHDVRIVTATPYYPEWEISKTYKNFYSTEIIDDCKVFRSPLYVPKNVSTIKRLLHLLSFAFFSFPQLFRNLFWKPEVVIMVEPTFFCAPSTLLFTFLTRAKSWLHVQDFELDIMLGLGMFNKLKFISKIAEKVERFLMKRFHRVSTVSYSMQQLLHRKGVLHERVYFLPNWVDVDFVSPKADRKYFRKKWGYHRDDIILLYSGNIGKKQGLELMLPAAESLQSHSNVRFVIVGQGAYKDELCELVEKTGVSNIDFYDLQPYEKLPDLLRMADFHFVIQKKGAGDVVMPSKLTSILSVGGTAIITAEEGSELGQFVAKNPKAAVLVEPENPGKFVKVVQDLVDSYERNDYNIVARQYAKENLCIKQVIPDMSLELYSVNARHPTVRDFGVELGDLNFDEQGK